MGDVRHEPSMEEILSSIKRIIAEDSEAVLSGARDRGNSASSSAGADAPAAAEEVLDLTSAAETEEGAAPAAREALVSGDAAEASRHALAALGSVAAKPTGTRSEPSLESVVREMLRPMLKDWLDAHLPELVERLVAREIERLRD